METDEAIKLFDNTYILLRSMGASPSQILTGIGIVQVKALLDCDADLELFDKTCKETRDLLAASGEFK